MKKAFLIISSLIVLAACGNANQKNVQDQTTSDVTADSLGFDCGLVDQQKIIMDILSKLPEEPEFDITTTLGTIRVKLYADTPKHRDNFAKLAVSGFYNKLLFHRVINGFMIQGGDPLTADDANKAQFGTGGPGYTVPAEILPAHKHKKGALAAARRGDAANPYRESSGSQFYIVQNEVACSQLDGQYTVYGETIEGLDVIDKIAAVQTDYRDCPETPVRILTIRPVEK